jgi:hypothetical protein
MHSNLSRLLMIAATAASTCLAVGAASAADVGVSVQISQPGVYGRVDIGRFPQPEVYVPQPVIVQRTRVQPQPVYMWVPPGHRQQWSRYCAQYRACGVPVYFVRDGWYEQRVRPHQHGWDDRRGRGPGWDRGRDDHHGERRYDRDGDRNHGGRDGRDGRGGRD